VISNDRIVELEAHNKELTNRMKHQSGHLIELLTEIEKLKHDIAWWQEVCRTKDQTIKQQVELIEIMDERLS